MTKQDKKHKQAEEEVVEEQAQPEINEEVKKLEEEVLTFKNLYLRALADYKNLENRVNNERGQMKDSVKKQIIMELLPVLDNLNQAEIFTTDIGLKMVAKSFSQALESLGVKEIELLGVEYDPYAAEVIEVVPGEQDNIVVEVLMKGYSLNGEVIRPGKVKVSKINS
ncbi:nucleotide exchange factor GrpE [soil metagenome]